MLVMLFLLCLIFPFCFGFFPPFLWGVKTGQMKEDYACSFGVLFDKRPKKDGMRKNALTYFTHSIMFLLQTFTRLIYLFVALVISFLFLLQIFRRQLIAWMIPSNEAVCNQHMAHMDSFFMMFSGVSPFLVRSQCDDWSSKSHVHNPITHPICITYQKQSI